jgi:U3 small nucleolar ribonucleoprotein protein LCP5
MAVDNSLESLLTTLTASIESAAQAIPQDGILPPKEGISLLDVKNELLLSYLQNLVFLILLKLRSRKYGADETPGDLQREVTKKLVELRVYLEKGVWPLENRLKYQIDKIIRTADTASRKPVEKPVVPARKKANPDDSDVSDEEPDEDGEAMDEDLDGVSYGPNRAAFVRPKTTSDERTRESAKDGIYRPPRVTPMAMPTTQGREEKDSRRQGGKSATLDEFVATELSTAPLAEPSIGSTIVSGGRRMKSEKERREEAERREYEESNFVRLPTQSKKDRAKNGGRARDGGWGGEEWRGLGAGLDRIERLTQKKGGVVGSLEKSRKRPISDGPRGTGAQVGEAFEKRRKYRR